MNQFYLEGIKPEIQKFYRIHYLILHYVKDYNTCDLYFRF